MKPILPTMVIWALTAVASYGQNPAAMSIRSKFEGMSGSPGQAAPQTPAPTPNAQAANPVDDWQQAKKLTILEKLPQSPHAPAECLPVTGLSEGSVGYLECWPTVVVKVVGPNDVVLALGNPSVTQILLTGCPTKGLVPGDKVRLVGPIEVVAAKSQPARPGQKAASVVQFVPQAKLDEAKAKSAAAASTAGTRKWTDSAGKFSVVASLVEFKDGQVHLKREDGKIIQVPASRLSQGDQKWVRDELARRTDAKRKALDPQPAAKGPAAKATPGG